MMRVRADSDVGLGIIQVGLGICAMVPVENDDIGWSMSRERVSDQTSSSSVRATHGRNMRRKSTSLVDTHGPAFGAM
jgi:hypothetical protein